MEKESKDKEGKNKGNLVKLKVKYKQFQERYKLPEFSFVNNNFEIEEINAEETDLFLKRIRKSITEKIFYILRTLEAFMNPSNAPLFIFNVLKSFSEADKELVKEMYTSLAIYEIEALGLESIYDEKKEAEFINKFCSEWKTSLSEDMNKIYLAMKEGYNKDDKKTSKSYFG